MMMGIFNAKEFKKVNLYLKVFVGLSKKKIYSFHKIIELKKVLTGDSRKVLTRDSKEVLTRDSKIGSPTGFKNGFQTRFQNRFSIEN